MVQGAGKRMTSPTFAGFTHWVDNIEGIDSCFNVKVV
jgi:hypothetical protein